jgi:hypothetical protein
MSQFRLVALLSLIGAAGCYNEAPAESTFPEQHYVSGPPGGAIDPDPSAYPNEGPQLGTSTYQDTPAYQDDQDGAQDDAQHDDEDLAGPSSIAPIEAPSGVALAPGADDVAGPTAPSDVDNADDADDVDNADPQAGEVGVSMSTGVGPSVDPAVAPTASVTDVEIDAALEGHGEWVENDEYGQIWRPDTTEVGVDFTPYESGGSWAYTDAGWAFNCDYSWGWLPFHYGRWSWFGDYWGWVPGHRWAPAWVEWRHGGGVVGWRPLPPRLRDHRRLLHREYRYGRGTIVRDHRRGQVHDGHWRFARTTDLGRPQIRAHLFRNSREGLRVTSRVSALPVRARTTVRAGDLMRNRFSGGRPGRFGGEVRGHRSPRAAPPGQSIRHDPRYQRLGPQRPYAPSQRVQPYQRGQSYDRGQPYQRGQSYDRVQPSNRGPSYDRGQRGQPNAPSRVYLRPNRPAQPPGQGYQPPTRVQRDAPTAPGRVDRPTRTFAPSGSPARTFTPRAPASAPVRMAPPSRASSPPASSNSRSSSPSPRSGGGSRHGGGRGSRN